MIRSGIFLLLVVSFVLLGSRTDQVWSESSLLGDVLIALGDEVPAHARPNANEELIQRGYELVHLGKSVSPEGKRSGYISKYFMCTSCHNQSIEDPDLRFSDPEARLDYTIEQGIKFLPATTFYGMANKESWYGGDYYRKYGDLVKPANKSLAEATQLCAKVCSSGRHLEEWELEAILAYYWNIQFKLSDLDLEPDEFDRLIKSLKEGEKSKDLIQLLKSKYLQETPVQFGSLPNSMYEGFAFEGNIENGRKIFENSCQSCHHKEGVSTILLDDDQATMNKFVRHLQKKTNYNLYKIIREGTYTEKGKPRYMPLYPKEKMSDQQIEDLRAFVEHQAAR